MYSNKRKKRTLIAILLFWITFSLITIIILIVNNTITLNSKDNSNINNTNINEENITTLSKNEALQILKTKFDFAINYFNSFQLPCGEDAELDYNIQQKNGMPYYRSKDFNSFNELNNTLLQYMTQNVINLKETYKEEYYLEQDDILYCWMLSGGTLEIYVPEKTQYVVNQLNDSSINATVNVFYESVDNTYTLNNTINVVLTKNNDNWQISEYEIQK